MSLPRWASSRAPAEAATRAAAATHERGAAEQAEVKKGGTVQVGHADRRAATSTRSWSHDRARLGVLGAGGRVPDLLGPRAQPAAAAGRELGAERGRLGVDVQDPPGRQVPRRHADDGGGRRRDVQPARRPRDRLQRALGVHRRALQGQRPGDRRDDGVFELDAPNGNFPYPLARTTTTSIILPKGFDPATGRRTSRAPARGSSTSTRRTRA